jgi:hypothetical protein
MADPLLLIRRYMRQQGRQMQTVSSVNSQKATARLWESGASLCQVGRNNASP